MMANTTITPSTCLIGETADLIKNDVSLAAYELFLPFYFLIGTCGHGICVYTFSKQYFKKEKAYAYQILVSIGDLVECIVVSLGRLTAGTLSGLRLQPGSDAYQENYAAMWFAGHIIQPLEQAVMTTSLLLYVMMAADRAFAVASPLRHNAFDHKTLQILAPIISVTLGVSTSIFDAFRLQVLPNGLKYELYPDETFADSTIASVCNIVRTILRLGANIALIASNITMVVGYRIERRQTKFIETNEHTMLKRRSTRKTLLLLTLFQSLFQTLDMTLYNIYFTLEYSIPEFAECYESVLAPICDLVQEITGTMELFALLTICKRLRQTIFAAMPHNVRRICFSGTK